VTEEYVWRVPREVVEMRVIYGRDIRCHSVDQPLQPGPHVIDGRFAVRGNRAREVQEVPVLVGAQQ
jgi:hypothetical protein